jgi:hypothetical protein
MGHIAFRNASSVNVDDLLGNSRLAESVVLAGTQILSQMGKDLDMRSSAELVQYIKVALTGLRQSFDVTDSNAECVFFTQRVRCCLYRLQWETSKIKGCPVVTFTDMVRETDPRCIKYLIPFIREMPPDSIDWSLLLPNKELLNEFFDFLLQNVGVEQIIEAVHSGYVHHVNLIKALIFLNERSATSNINYAAISQIPGIWDKLPIEILESAASQNGGFEAKFLLKCPQLYRSPIGGHALDRYRLNFCQSGKPHCFIRAYFPAGQPLR